MIAYCWASGLIQFGRSLPNGAIEIARGPAKVLRRKIEVTARRSYAGEPLVPGVPEAENAGTALTALQQWQQWLVSRGDFQEAGINVAWSPK